MLSSRQKLILKAIIDEYVNTAQPVGSKFLTQVPYLTFSSATLRYDMAELELLGYLEKTHTSSGRIPSELGYKYYVDHLITRDAEVQSSFPIIDDVLKSHQIKRDHAIEEAVKLLSDLTNYTALAIGPTHEILTIKKVDFIPLSDKTATLLIVTNQGHVEHQTISIPEALLMSDLKETIKTLDELIANKTLEEASLILNESLMKNDLKTFMDFQTQLMASFIDAFSKFSEENVFLSGMTRMFDQPEFDNSGYIKRFVEMLDRRDLVKLIGQKEGLQVRFGSDMKLIPMENCTLISIPYQINQLEHGTIAIIGPNRMPYGKVIPLLEYIALNIGKLYKK
jgi:heat-inducible transcriptional repressor